jgi:hypothetical protein
MNRLHGRFQSDDLGLSQLTEVVVAFNRTFTSLITQKPINMEGSESLQDVIAEASSSSSGNEPPITFARQ